jgi:hypothetical protein
LIHDLKYIIQARFPFQIQDIHYAKSNEKLFKMSKSFSFRFLN